MHHATHRFEGPALLAFAAAVAITLAGCADADQSPTPRTAVGEEREVAGTATETTLTACAPVSGKPGTCDGTLVVQPAQPGATAVTVEVTRDVLLKKGEQAVLLPQLRGSAVVVRYRATTEGPNLATSVIGQ